MSMNWLEGMSMDHDMMEQPGQPMAMPVFAGQKLVVVGGSSGMGRQTAADVVAAGGSAVIIGDGQDKVDETVKGSGQGRHGVRDNRRPHRPDAGGAGAPAARRRARRRHPARQRRGLFLPKPFLDYEGADYDPYLELDWAIFFITQTVARGMVAQGRGGSIVNIGSMWAHQAIGATPSSAYSTGKGGSTR